MYRVTLQWRIEEIQAPDEDVDVVDAEIISDTYVEEDPDFLDRMADIAYWDALANTEIDRNGQ